MAGKVHDCTRKVFVRRLTDGPRAHFFGYYYHSQWSPDQTRLLALRADPEPRLPAPGQAAVIGVIDAQTGAWRAVARTCAWNWQAGCNLQWLTDTQFIYNDWIDDSFRAVVFDLNNHGRRVLSRAVCDVNTVAGRAAAIDFGRLAAARPVLGYAHENRVNLQSVPVDDGLWLLDLATGREVLALSLAACVGLADGPDFDTAAEPPAYCGRPGFEQPTPGHRLGGAQVSPSGRYLIFSHHWPRRRPLELPHFQRHVWDRLLVYDCETGKHHRLGPDGFYSHYVWIDDRAILLWGEVAGRIGLWNVPVDGSAPVTVLPDVVRQDPHASFSPDHRRLLGDGYPVDGVRPLWICDLETGDRYDIGAFASPSPFDRGPCRCDLHPRWRPDGQAVAIDSAHEGIRQVYVIDVSTVCR